MQGSRVQALKAALELAPTGVAVFPCAHDKHPRTPHAFYDASADAETVQARWRRYGGMLVGIATGKASGLAALDIDAKHAAAVSDLEGGKEVTHTISHLLEDVVKFDREMDILCFTDTGKQLQVNVTNGEWLLDNFGNDPNDWGGHRVTLYLAPYQLKGKETKLGIRLKRADGSASTGGPPPSPRHPRTISTTTFRIDGGAGG